MADFDFGNPPVSKVTADLKGVGILLWGGNGCGKTPVACKMPKPYYLAFESGLTGMQGVPYAPMPNWKRFIEFVKWATNPATTEKAHEVAQTIVLDTLDVMADYCIDYICMKLGVQSLGETRYTSDGKKDGSVNAYTEYGREFKRQTRALRLAGFTLVYIAHDGGYHEDIDPVTHQRYNKLYPSGDRRALEPICNDVDVIGFMQPSPLDENGKPQFSNIFFAPNNQYHTRSRYPDIVPYIEHVTADSLCKAIIDAKQKELDRTGSQASTFEEQQEEMSSANSAYTFEELYKMIFEKVQALVAAGRKAEYDAIVSNYFDKGKGVSDATPEQKPLLELVWGDLENI